MSVRNVEVEGPGLRVGIVVEVPRAGALWTGRERQDGPAPHPSRETVQRRVGLQCRTVRGRIP